MVDLVTKTIPELDEKTSTDDDDLHIVYDDAGGVEKKVKDSTIYGQITAKIGLLAAAFKNVGTASGELATNAQRDTINGVTYLAMDKINWPTISNAADTNHDITFSAGSILVNGSSSVITLASALTKQIDAAWAVGDAAGGLFSGTVAADTTYHCFLIVKDSGGTIDAGFDTSLSAANIPTGYTAYRRVHSLITDSSSNFIGFEQVGDRIYKDAPMRDLNSATGSTAGTTVAVSLPTGLSSLVGDIVGELFGNAGIDAWIRSANADNVAPSGTSREMITTANSETSVITRLIPINSSGLIQYRNTTIASGSITIRSQGWIDQRIE